MKKALIVWGGWDGHEPKPCADLFADVLGKEGFEVELSDTLDAFLDTERLKTLDLVTPMWTCGELTHARYASLQEAVLSGVGLGGFHGGMGDAFHDSIPYQFMVGGQFTAHPDGAVEYTVHIAKPNDPIIAGIRDFKVRSEQYYMLVDPAVEVLATTTFKDPKDQPWLKGCLMPVVWKRPWGKGRVFYSSLGHAAKEFSDYPQMLEITKRGMLWASR